MSAKALFMCNDDNALQSRTGPRTDQLSVAIVGANGIVGRWLAGLAVESGHIVTGIDLNEHSSLDLSYSEYLRADITAPTSEAIIALGKADWVLICLPEETALSATPSLLSIMKQDALWVDTLSVKMRQVSRLHSCLGTCEALSINPMVAPTGHLQGGNVAVVTIRHGPSADLFTKMLRSAGFTIQQTTAEAHDRKVAVVQIATHAAILSFAEVLCNLGGDINDLVPFGTPPFLAMASLAARMASLSPLIPSRFAGPPSSRTRSKN